MALKFTRILVCRYAMFLLLTTIVAFGASAQLTAGKVYNFESVGRGGKALSSNNSCTLGPAGINRNNYHQLWLAVEGEGNNAGQFTLRNLGNGLYLDNPEEVGKVWTLIPTIALDHTSYGFWVKKEGTDNVYYYSPVNGASDKCMQLTNDNLVCGSSDNTSSQWRIVEVEMTQKQIEDQLKSVAKYENERTEIYRAKIYEKSLYKIFINKACTELTEQYRIMTDSELEQDADYRKLPVVLRNMVKKIRNDNWTEKNADSNKPEWSDKYARKFRVQLYEPYSDPHQAGIALSIQPHSVLNNPTGIYASKGDTIYVMLEGPIDSGSEVYLGSYQGYNRPENNAQRGTKLKEGLNIVTYQRDSTSTFVCYNVETFKNGKQTDLRLSDYKDLKIHIEGGNINGYYNRMGDKLFEPDRNADWEYYEERANMPFITILGKYQVLQFYKDSMKSNDGRTYPGLTHYLNERVSVEDVIAAWDKLMFNQRLTLGVLSEKEIEEAREKFPTHDDPTRGIYGYIGNDPIAAADYSDSYRVHGMSLGQLTGYMVGSNGYSGYNISTFEAITVGMASKEHSNYGNLWGAAHEIGHQHQALIHMNGLKESSNNLFSNVAVWFDGKATSNMADGALSNLLSVYNRKDGDFFHTTLGVQMHLYYKLWLYYHLAGKNNKFYPRLFELLRRNPMKISSDQDGADCLLHFYKMCCIAAEEDLTEFFRAHCFFTPLKQRHVADYSSSDYTMTQSQVDAAINEIKALKLPLNRNIIFINDCSGKPALSHDGVTLRNIYGGKTHADIGMYTDFIYPEQGKVVGTYSYRFVDGKVVMSGATGGVGFLVYDDEDMLQAFSDRYSFPLSERARKKLSTHDLRFYVIDGAGNMIEIKSDDVVGEQRELLRSAINDAKSLLKKVDDKNRRIGFFNTESVVNLKQILATAEKVYEDMKKEDYISISYLLTEECAKVDGALDSRILFVPNSSYLLECEHSPNMFVTADNEGKLVLNADESAAGKWLFELAGENSYYIKLAGTDKYMSKAEKSVMVKLVDKKDAPTYHIETLDNNYFAIGCTSGYLNYNHNQKYVQGWAKIEGSQSRWRMSLIGVQEAEQKYQELSKALEKSEALVRKVADMNDINLQTVEKDSVYYLYCNAPSSVNMSVNGSASNGYNLLDNNVNTYLHTETDNNKNSIDGKDHYLLVDMQNKGHKVVSMRYTTRNAESMERPKAILIEGSNDGEQFVPIMTISQGLPKHRTTEFETPLFKADYRYIRFMVTATYGGKTSMGHPYFSMSSLSIATPVLKDKYSSVDLDKLLSEITVAREVLEAGREDVEQLQVARERLDAAYATFEVSYSDVEQQSFNNKKEQLQQLINQSDMLLRDVATVSYVENRDVAYPVVVPLQCTDEEAKGYILTNADHNVEGNNKDGGGVAALYDNNVNTFLHTRYSGPAVNEAHYLMVKLSTKPGNAEFDFNYTTRNASGGPHPTEIRVQHSVDGVEFEEIKVFTDNADALPQGAANSWKSPKLTPNGEFCYLRFVVPKSSNRKLHANQYFFSLSEFGVRSYEYKTDVSVILNEGLSCVSDSLVIDMSLSLTTALSVASMAASESMLDEQIAELQKVYAELYRAKEASAPYNELNAFGQSISTLNRELTAGLKVGQWTEASAHAYNEAYRQAAYLLESKRGDAADYVEALKAWMNAYEALEVNQPEPGAIYTVRRADDNMLQLSVDAGNKLCISTATGMMPSCNIWKFVNINGKMYMQNMHTSSYLAVVSEGSSLDVRPKSNIVIRPLADDGKIVIDSANGQSDSVAPLGWYIDEVVETESVGYEMVVNGSGFAQLYLEYPVRLPYPMEVHILSAVVGNTVRLNRVIDEVLPARIPVIVKAPAGTYWLPYVDTAVYAQLVNKLRGTSYDCVIECDMSTSYYSVDLSNNYKTFKKLSKEYDADGTIAEGNEGTDNGGHIKVPANSVYLPLPANAQPDNLTVQFDDQTTGVIDVIVDSEQNVIYDLSGYRVDNIGKSGVYIVNGKKELHKVVK